jgi:hypothetical protein
VLALDTWICRLFFASDLTEAPGASATKEQQVIGNFRTTKGTTCQRYTPKITGRLFIHITP